MFAFWDRLLAFMGLWLNWTVQQQYEDGPIVSGEMHQWLEGLRERWGVKGMSVVVVTSPEYKFGNGGWNQEIISLGTADGASRPITPDTIWSLPSTSKFVTSLALTHLIDSNVTIQNGNVLDWETPMMDIMHGWSATANSALGDEYNLCNISVYDLGFNKGGAYSRDGRFELASYVVERVSGQKFVDYARERILTPMGIDFGFAISHTDAQRNQRVDGFVREGIDIKACSDVFANGGNISHPSCRGEARNVGWWTDRYSGWENREEWSSGAMGMTLSAVEMPILLRSVLDRSRPIRELVSRDFTYRMLIEEFEGDERAAAGFSTEFYSFSDKMRILHQGSMDGQSSMMTWVPDDGIAIMVAVNDDTYGREVAWSAAFTLLEELPPQGLAKVWEKGTSPSYMTSRLWHKVPVPIASTSPSINITGTYLHHGGLIFPISLTDVEGMWNPARRNEQDAIIHAITTQTEYPLNTTGPIYFSEIFNTELDGLAFTHWDGNHWNWTAIKTYADSYNQDAAHFGAWLAYMEGHITVQILGTGSLEVLEHGLKMKGVWWDTCGEKLVRSADQSFVEEEGWYAMDIVLESFAPRFDEDKQQFVPAPDK